MGASQIAKSLDKPHMLGDGEWIACCPAHKDRTASLSISDNAFTMAIHHTQFVLRLGVSLFGK